MTGILRFIGVINAAIWCGSSVSLVAEMPALFTPEMKRLLTPPYVGFAAEAVMGRYFAIYYCCSAVALLCLAADWFYSGKGSRTNLALVVSLTVIGLVGGLGLQKNLRAWHYLKYYGKTLDQQTQAAKAFALWHGVSQLLNLVAICGLIVYLWRTSRSVEPARFVSFNKIRG